MTDTADALWRRNGDLVNACLAHPFVQGIASGELARECFQVYVAQDAYFLETFARAYALALARCPDLEGIAVVRDLLVGVFEELELHRGYAKRWDIDPRRSRFPRQTPIATFSCAPHRSSRSMELELGFFQAAWEAA